jgi:hypothetical protein
MALLSTGSARAEEKISDEAKAYFRNGVELIQSSPPNYQDAYYQFKLAYEKSGSWKVLGNLGLCALKMERDGEALEHYTNYLKGGGNDIDPEERKALERDSLLISGNSAVVNLTAATPDADVLDTRAGSAVPPQPYRFAGTSLTLRLRSGSHKIVVTSSDGKTETWEVVLSPGRSVDHRFELGTAAPAATPAAAPSGAQPPPTAAAPVAPGAQPPPAADQPKKSSPLKLVGFIAAGVGGAAIIGGVVTGLMAKSKDKKATDQCVNKVCPTAAEKDFDSAASLATVTNVLFIGGGVLAAAGVGLIIVGGKSSAENPNPASAPRLRLTPVAGSGGVGLFATGSF